MEVLILKNPLSDSCLITEILPVLKKEFPQVKFREFNNGDNGKQSTIILHSMDGIENASLSEENGKKTIAIPEKMKKREALEEIKKILYPSIGVRKVRINEKDYNVIRIICKNKNANARVKNGNIIVKIPVWWPNHVKEKIALELEERVVRKLTKDKWVEKTMPKIDFEGISKFMLMGKEYKMQIKQSTKNSCCLIGDTFVVSLKNQRKLSEIMKKEIVRNILPLLECRIRQFNDAAFRSEISNISLRDNLTRWGSWCKGKIILNMRLLFGPLEILDYVIVHEIAHSKVGAHNKRYWSIVEKVLPDYKQRRKWLKENVELLKPTCVLDRV